MVAYLGLFQYTAQEKYAKVIDPITIILCRIEYLRCHHFWLKQAAVVRDNK
jgi:hypothetical protein